MNHRPEKVGKRKPSRKSGVNNTSPPGPSSKALFYTNVVLASPDQPRRNVKAMIKLRFLKFARLLRANANKIAYGAVTLAVLVLTLYLIFGQGSGAPDTRGIDQQRAAEEKRRVLLTQIMERRKDTVVKEAVLKRLRTPSEATFQEVVYMRTDNDGYETYKLAVDSPDRNGLMARKNFLVKLNGSTLEVLVMEER